MIDEEIEMLTFYNWYTEFVEDIDSDTYVRRTLILYDIWEDNYKSYCKANGYEAEQIF
ncbi:MAG: hypothetical protein ACRDD8_11455 [Bacteroidales bacterium]